MQFTLCLSEVTAARIAERISRFGGSVPGYAASLAEEMSLLTVGDEDEIRTLIRKKIRQRIGSDDEPLPPEWQPTLRRAGRKRIAALQPHQRNDQPRQNQAAPSAKHA
jgi:hypothetical protein